MLPGAEQISELEVDEFTPLFFDEFGYFSWGHRWLQFNDLVSLVQTPE